MTKILFSFFLAGAYVLAQTPANDQNQQDRQFVEHVAQMDMTEAHIGQMAQQKAASDSVKNFGQTLDQDHTQNYEKLSALASQLGITMPQAIDAQHQRDFRPLEHLSGKAFDQRLKSMEIKDHQQAIAWVKGQENSLQNPQLKTFASELADTLQKHLTMAEALGSKAANNPSASNMSGAAGAMNSNAGNGAEDNGSTRASMNAAAAGTSAMAGSNMAGANSAAMQSQKVRYGTVTAFTPGKQLVMKIRGHLGRHEYNLSSLQVQGETSNLKPGDQVVVTEMVDRNGHRSIRVEPENQANANGNVNANQNNGSQPGANQYSGNNNQQ